MAGKSYPQQIHDRGFAQGLAVACSIFVRGHGEHPAVTEALIACNLDTRQKLKRFGVDDYDLNILRPVLAEIRRSKESLKARLTRPATPTPKDTPDAG